MKAKKDILGNITAHLFVVIRAGDAVFVNGVQSQSVTIVIDENKTRWRSELLGRVHIIFV
jgi:hypothetical protein